MCNVKCAISPGDIKTVRATGWLWLTAYQCWVSDSKEYSLINDRSDDVTYHLLASGGSFYFIFYTPVLCFYLFVCLFFFFKLYFFYILEMIMGRSHRNKISHIIQWSCHYSYNSWEDQSRWIMRTKNSWMKLNALVWMILNQIKCTLQLFFYWFMTFWQIIPAC